MSVRQMHNFMLKMDARLAEIESQKILDSKNQRNQQSINEGLERKVLDLTSDLLSEIEKNKQIGLDRDTDALRFNHTISKLIANHAAEVKDLKLVISSLQDTVKDLKDYQLTTVCLFYSSFSRFH